MSKPIIDNKGHLIGREVNGVMLDGKGHNVSRFISSSNRTVDSKGKNVGVGDQRLRQLGKVKA
jgi:sporulation protein YlmC with PRC-barrel domain